MNEQEILSVPDNKLKAEEIIQLYERYGNEDYDGKPVSQTSHMVQCAMRAIKDTVDPELIIASFLHDIGHLLKHLEPVANMGFYGIANHEGLGAEYLRVRGFSEKICALVGMLVQAKRYLVATNADYTKKLSEASWHSLHLQGGSMNELEVKQFKQRPYFRDIIRVRLWDEEAKDPYAILIPLYHFRTLLEMYFNKKK